MSGWHSWDGDDLALLVKIQPRSRRNEFVDLQQNRLRVRITAPPVDDKANTQLCTWLADQFAVTRSAVRIENGKNGRRKRIRISSPSRMPKPDGARPHPATLFAPRKLANSRRNGPCGSHPAAEANKDKAVAARRAPHHRMARHHMYERPSSRQLGALCAWQRSSAAHGPSALCERAPVHLDATTDAVELPAIRSNSACSNVRPRPSATIRARH